MEIRRKFGVRLRDDAFGGLCYVPHRDDFFAANHDVFRVIKTLSSEWVPVDSKMSAAYRSLAEIGICETRNPVITERAYSGPGLLGDFKDIPSVSEALVLNVFSTAYCPLKCLYCHADDLMQNYRARESNDDLVNITATARSIPSMVAVITGGDPITRPDRASYLIEQLAHQKALVLDTSGVGNIDPLLPALSKHRVHVRISLDALGNVNDGTRPINRAIIRGETSSYHAAVSTLNKCVDAGLSVTVQTVVSARNEGGNDLLDLRDWLIGKGIRHWVLHIAINAGKARLIEERMSGKRRGAILPGGEVYGKVNQVIRQTQRENLPLDIRCTDTNNTPNSVLLVNSQGDLYTEGYAHNGKVLLYEADKARPDEVKRLWHHIDKFGHACRYLNWNRRLNEGQSIQSNVYSVELPIIKDTKSSSVVETESKYRVTDKGLLHQILVGLGFEPSAVLQQRDEYYDTDERALHSLDLVVRLRAEASADWISVKGPRFYTQQGDYSRIELEFEPKSLETVRRDLAKRDLSITWVFEKRRNEYRSSKSSVVVMLDEIPKAGYYVELEGAFPDCHALAKKLGGALGEKESRNYKDIYLAYALASDMNVDDVKGAEF